jgi:hypothetical protein
LGLLKALVQGCLIDQLKEPIRRLSITSQLGLHLIESGDNLLLGIDQFAGKVGFCEDKLAITRMKPLVDSLAIFSEQPFLARR